ncbi:hypothetical protein GQ54DRAFT_331094 [Martensiomyces pterosporus]|nr:hypothetical protein GQ54DRAFT_331094 [Martensiomyces pterosporus]
MGDIHKDNGATEAADVAALMQELDLGTSVIQDSAGMEWLDITELMKSGASELSTGELIKPSSFSLFDAMTSIEVMDARLDMGMLSAEDEAEIAKWDINRALTFADCRWILNRMFCCEMTWQDSASLLQTIYMCNYFTAQELPDTIANPAETTSPVRDLLLYPLLIATGRCCRLVWSEYMRENVYAEEDVYFGSYAARFFDEFTLANAVDYLNVAKAYLVEQLATQDMDETERGAAQMILDQLELRRHWLSVLVHLSIDYLIEDPGALDKSMHELEALKKHHTSFVDKYKDEIAQDAQDDANSPLSDRVPGVFDRKCMRNYPSMAPIKPKQLKSLSESHKFLSNIIDELALVKELMSIEDVETMLYFFMAFSRRSPTPSPFARSLMVSVFSSEGRVLLMQPIIAFVGRSIREVTGSYVWDVMDLADSKAKSLNLMQPPVDDLIVAKQRVDAFCQEAARMLIDWIKTLCQNTPRQRRIALKYLVGWDSLQGEAEQLDIWLYTTLNSQRARRSEEAADPEFNPFWFSSWAYHLKLVLMEMALMSGIRLDVYLSYEFPTIFCYATQIFEAHYAHLARMAQMLSTKQGQNPQLLKTAAAAGKKRQPVLWTMRTVTDKECLAQVERWQVLTMVQKDLATAVWLISHGCERLGVFQAPWAQRRTQLALETCRAQELPEAQAARYALRFRVFSRLNSPTPLTFSGWTTTTKQLDEYKIAELFVHAGKILGNAKAALEASRKSLAAEMGSQSRVFAAWDAYYRALYFVVLSNSLSLGKLARSPVLQSPAVSATGADALMYRDYLLNAAIAAFADTKSGAEAAQVAESSSDTPQQQTDAKSARVATSKSKAKREKKKRRAAKQETDTLAVAREWRADVDVQTAKVLKVEWKCVADKHPDWPIFTF